MFKIPFTMVLCLLTAIASLCAANPAQADSNKLVLVENRQALAPIVVYKDAPLLTRLAADELARYIEQATGAKPQVIQGWPQPLPEHAIWVGYQKGLEKLFPKVDFNFEHPEEILFAANENHLVIAGRDRWDPDHLDQTTGMIEHGFSRDKPVPGVQQEYGTANAVYEFLHNHLGVRWLWPGEVEVPEQSTFAIAPMTYRYHPQMRSRMQMFWHLSRGRASAPGNDESNWYRYHHLQLDSLQTHAGGHAFADWWSRFSKTHPEYFALQPDGTRSGFPGGKRAKICESNPAVWEQWLKDVDETLAKNPTQVAFSAAANDSWTSGHCICENCRAWDDLSAPRRMFSWQGLGQEYVALSDRQVRFANTLARKLKERYPDRKLYVSILSYGFSRPAPVSVVPDDNVIIGGVANFLFNPDGIDAATKDEKYVDQFKAWGKLTHNLYWRPNVNRQVQWGQPLSTHILADHYKVLAETKAIGIYVDTLYRYWALNGPVYYLMGRLTWNFDQDATAVLDDYFDKGFGPAAPAMKQYQGLLDDARDLHYAQGNGTDGTAWASAYTPEFFGEAEALLKKAADQAQGQAKYAHRVAFMSTGLEFLKLYTQGLVLAQQIKADQDKEQALAQLTANWQRLQAIAKEHPYAISPRFFTLIRKGPSEINPVRYQ